MQADQALCFVVLWGVPESGCGDAGRDAASGFVRLQRPGFLVNPVFTTVIRPARY